LKPLLHKGLQVLELIYFAFGGILSAPHAVSLKISHYRKELHLIMPTDLEKQINIKWKKLSDINYVYLPTGESFNNYEYLGSVKREIEGAQLKDFHEHSKLLNKFGIDVDRKIKNKGDKAKIKTTSCVAWKDANTNLFI